MEATLVQVNSSTVVVKFSSGDTSTISTKTNVKNGNRTNTVIAMPEIYQGFVSPWGEDNLWPQNLVKLIDSNDFISTVIQFKADAITSEGVAYGHSVIDNKGNKHLERMIDPEVEDFLEMNNSQQFFEEAALEQFTYENRYGQITLNQAGTKVAQIYSHDTTECRLSVQDQTDGSIPYAIISANWESGADLDYRMILPALDPYYDLAGQIKRQAGKHKAFILPQRKIYRGRKFYAKPTWYGYIESKWFDVTKEIPKYKLFRMKDDIKARYHIQFHEQYFIQKYKGFAELSQEDQIKKYNEEIAIFIESLTGNDDQSGLIFSFYGFDKILNKEIPSMKITPIKTERMTGELLEDSQEGDYHGIRALGVHPTLIGVNGKTGLGAGSGSDQREAWNSFLLRTKGVQNTLLREHQVAAKINGWNNKVPNKKFEFWFDRYLSVTLDEGVDNKKLQGNADK